MNNGFQKKKIVRTKKRLAVMFLIVSLLLVFCIFWAIILVVKNGDEYYHKALAQATGTGSTILSQPGNIVDANGTVLSATKRVYRLILDPKVLMDTEEKFEGSEEKTIELLTENFELDPEALKEAFHADEKASYVRFGKEAFLTDKQVDAYKAAVDQFNAEKKEYNANHKEDKITARVVGVWFEEEYRREYPLNDILSKTIGYTTRDGKNGIIGLEYYYNTMLRGTDGKKYSYIDSDGNVVDEVVEAVDGYDIHTSLDANVAGFVKDSIDEFMENTGGERVNVVVMNPRNGEIVAMESNTEFDLNDPTNLTSLFTEEELNNPKETFLLQEAFKGKKDQLENMTNEEAKEALLQQVQINYPISGTYEPGSTAKVFTLAAGIEEGLIDPDETFYCDGAIQEGPYTIHCHMNTFCGNLKPIEALARSCNVCFVQMGKRIGVPTFTKYQEIFNLGQKTNIDLPGEANTQGLLYTADNMNDIELCTCSFGQGFNVTMMQMVSAYASVVNGGYYYEPHIATKITDKTGRVVREIEPKLVRRTISESTSKYLKEALRYVTIMGTANYAVTEGYDIGGKTGASEKLPRGTGKYIVSFIGIVPIEDAELIVYATIDEPHVPDQSLSQPAQELVKSCLEKLYAYYGIYPEDDADAYTYDWASLKNSAGDGESANGESFIEDPNQSIQWLTDNQTPEDQNSAFNPIINQENLEEIAGSEEQSGNPESAVTESAAPESAVPESAVPESAAPESPVPESAVPESPVPESVVPESVVPESPVPPGP